MTVGYFIEDIKKAIMYKKTCKQCKKNIRKFCRRFNVAKNSKACELAYKGKFNEVKDLVY